MIGVFVYQWLDLDLFFEITVFIPDYSTVDPADHLERKNSTGCEIVSCEDPHVTDYRYEWVSKKRSQLGQGSAVNG